MRRRAVPFYGVFGRNRGQVLIWAGLLEQHGIFRFFGVRLRHVNRRILQICNLSVLSCFFCWMYVRSGDWARRARLNYARLLRDIPSFESHFLEIFDKCLLHNLSLLTELLLNLLKLLLE